jgi:RNA polymerase sigma factor (sigma-70 family)
MAVDILQETVIEALEHTERFNVTRQPLAWLRGIAVNVIWRKKVAQAKHARRELSLGRLFARQRSFASEQDVLDRLMPATENVADLGLELESDEGVAGILSLLSPADQEIVRLAILEDYERERLAEHLGTSVGTARMRLHRALRRLQSAWVNQQTQARKRETHG